MEDRNGDCPVLEETVVDQPSNNNRTTWTNGQCVMAVPSASAFNPTFDLSLCRTKLERKGFEVPAADMEVLLKTALDVPSVRRYLVLNSGFFHFIMAPVMYVVVWCAVFSTLHLYISFTDFWILCLSVSLVSILLTTAIIFILHHTNKEIDVNVDVRLVRVNEAMAKHKLLVGVADWVKNCSGNTQLFFVYWDMSRCLRTLTETLEESCFMTPETQDKLRSRMSRLVLVSEARPADPEAVDGRGSDAEQDPDENRPLLRNEDAAASIRPGGAKVTTSLSLVPEASLSAQAKAHQLLMTYSAVYVKLLMSERLSGPSNHRLRRRRNHCATGPICLCQYTKNKTLQ
ncbi:transmembrane protein 268 [Kryptolebias marmoratus]|uniref:Transmembrane protein 268 n=1 Tax=Kryptolebias marmoratus TaxID=37003 RepID=A0A3Q3ALT6_KRYMA|nr:transmembrane protein 268 [Kryptolebias marmoratus]XP_024862683.1 transmembrane protein 268 [Kryptolebias marmoratus]